jgi:hypothetical protein
MSLPRSGAIRRAFNATRREIKLTLKEMNGRAGKFMARGDYVRAQGILEQAKQVQQFSDELRAFQKRLGQLRGGNVGPKPPKNERHAEWEYYQPLLQCLSDIDGDVTREQIEKLFEQRFNSWLKSGDRVAMRRGEPRWTVMIRRSKKHLIAEGFVVAPNHLTWRITPAGRKAAEQEVVAAQRS